MRLGKRKHHHIRTVRLQYDTGVVIVYIPQHPALAAQNLGQAKECQGKSVVEWSSANIKALL